MFSPNGDHQSTTIAEASPNATGISTKSTAAGLRNTINRKSTTAAPAINSRRFRSISRARRASWPTTLMPVSVTCSMSRSASRTEPVAAASAASVVSVRSSRTATTVSTAPSRGSSAAAPPPSATRLVTRGAREGRSKSIIALR